MKWNQKINKDGSLGITIELEKEDIYICTKCKYVIPDDELRVISGSTILCEKCWEEFKK